MVFIILRVLPGDPAALALGMDATPQALDALRRQMGLDRPIPVQYVLFLWDVGRGNFGTSLGLTTMDEPALRLVLERAPATLELAIPALLLAVLIALPLGMIAATYANSFWDRLISALTLGAQSMPNFWVGLMLILVLARNLGILPTSGRGTWEQMVMPIATLALPLMSVLARFVRAGMLENLRMDYVRTARAKGLVEWAVRFRHIFRNILIPVVTTVGLQAGALLGGSVVVETVFAWPGMGRLTADAILRRDYPVVQAGVLVIALIIVLVNLMVDLIYSILDPRISFK
jgi:ABC-type dipeptide/oligopeptide/nickel transport system permease component